MVIYNRAHTVCVFVFVCVCGSGIPHVMSLRIVIPEIFGLVGTFFSPMRKRAYKSY